MKLAICILAAAVVVNALPATAETHSDFTKSSSM
jgi:hypothetical protein